MPTRSRVRTLTKRIYEEVEVALWASLVAFVIYFCTFLLPEMPKQIAKAQREIDLQVLEENRRYCEKWGKEFGTQEHNSCALDLQELRYNIEKRFADTSLF